MRCDAKFHHPTFNRSEVIVLTNKQTPLKTSTSLRYAKPVGNQLVTSSREMAPRQKKHAARVQFVFAEQTAVEPQLNSDSAPQTASRWVQRRQLCINVRLWKLFNVGL